MSSRALKIEGASWAFVDESGSPELPCHDPGDLLVFAGVLVTDPDELRATIRRLRLDEEVTRLHAREMRGESTARCLRALRATEIDIEAHAWRKADLKPHLEFTTNTLWGHALMVLVEALVKRIPAQSELTVVVDSRGKNADIHRFQISLDRDAIRRSSNTRIRQIGAGYEVAYPISDQRTVLVHVLFRHGKDDPALDAADLIAAAIRRALRGRPDLVQLLGEPRIHEFPSGGRVPWIIEAGRKHIAAGVTIPAGASLPLKGPRRDKHSP